MNKKNYFGNFPKEHSVVCYYVSKDGKTVSGGRAVLANSKIIKEKKLTTKKKINDYNNRQIEHSLINLKHHYLADKFGLKNLTSKILEDSWEINIK